MKRPFSLRKRFLFLKVRGGFSLLEAIFCLFLISLALKLFLIYAMQPKNFPQTIHFATPFKDYQELQRKRIILKSQDLVFEVDRVLIQSQEERFFLLENIE